MDNNLRSRSEVIAERGYDAEEVDAEIAADQARAKRLGIAPKAAAPEPPEDDASGNADTSEADNKQENRDAA